MDIKSEQADSFGQILANSFIVEVSPSLSHDYEIWENIGFQRHSMKLLGMQSPGKRSSWISYSRGENIEKLFFHFP